MSRQAATLLLILAVLISGAWLNGELKRAGELTNDRTTLLARTQNLASQQQALANDIGERLKKAADAIGHYQSFSQQAQAQRQIIWEAHPWKRMLPLSEPWIEIRLLDQAIESYEALVERDLSLITTWKSDWSVSARKMEGDMAQMQAQLRHIDEQLQQDFVLRLATLAGQQLPLAIGILLGIIFLPVFIKLLLYFVIAPWAAHQPALRLMPSSGGRATSPTEEHWMGSSRTRMSAVSQSIVLGEDQELLVQQGYLQSSSHLAKKQTRWLLQARYPMTSLLSGMVMLTRVGPAGSEPVVVSATRDPLSEVGLLDLAKGAAFVCQPRSLAGIIQDRRHPVRITSHWRLTSLHSWLTLQLRFLVFHGPGQLIMKGTRGIRIESAATGRLINQAATLGFSAHLEYSCTRCETFAAYWLGKENLFNDSFRGQDGVYVYQEMPALNRTVGITGRGIEGFADGMLKIFGI